MITKSFSQLDTLNYIEQELSDLLKKQEQNE